MQSRVPLVAISVLYTGSSPRFCSKLLNKLGTIGSTSYAAAALRSNHRGLSGFCDSGCIRNSGAGFAIILKKLDRPHLPDIRAKHPPPQPATQRLRALPVRGGERAWLMPQTKGQHWSAGLGGAPDRTRYLLQVSRIIFRLVTLRSPYSSLLAAFSIWPSCFPSALACAFGSRLAEPVTDTL